MDALLGTNNTVNRAFGVLFRHKMLAAQDQQWGPIQYQGELHDRATYRYFWSLLKRTLGGTYVAVAPFHLNRYVAEQVYRFNARQGTDFDRFREVLSRVFGRRLTYRVLTGQDGAGFMGLT